ncbi:MULTISPECIES: hypothetical protein [Neobacillus]|uniref:Uncharacterized protein n=1 Tax=Neobacillus sedimentimangrovi TaxID=2699460 RepID=A0ABS8QDV3_9BACI|nr:hypothetical protein [Neobacillus sedimentimangrovi]MCD4837440.1 hypothetical protein [Neobacillus sedimentimangrovi]
MSSNPNEPVDMITSTSNNPVRDRIKSRNPADFSSASLRRLALSRLGRSR